MKVVLNNSVVVASDWRFDNQSGNLSSESEWVVSRHSSLKMTTAPVVETSVTVNNNSPIQDYVHPDHQTQPTFETSARVNIVIWFWTESNSRFYSWQCLKSCFLLLLLFFIYYFFWGGGSVISSDNWEHVGLVDKRYTFFNTYK